MAEAAKQMTLDFDPRRAARPTPTKAAGDRRRVLALLIERGATGATDHEIAEALGMLGDTARARRCELRDEGLVIDSGRRRPSPSGHAATVWAVRTAATIGEPTPAPAAAAIGADRAASGGGACPIGHTAEVGETSTRVDLSARPSVGPCPRCGSTRAKDVPIHDGQSVRRDCARCGRFIGFPIWYGKRMEG